MVKNDMLHKNTEDRAMKAKLSGFTLIELMIVVVIVGVLAMIALPAYQDFIRKGRRADVLTKLLDTQLQQEKWRANNIKYAATAASVGSPSSDYYSFIVVAATNSYTLVATPTANKGQANDKQYGTDCGVGLYINQNGEKGHYSSTPNVGSIDTGKVTPSECWRK
jgi:type IV pilus assembly protein PilE